MASRLKMILLWETQCQKASSIEVYVIRYAPVWDYIMVIFSGMNGDFSAATIGYDRAV
jgi:hypothetical protein